MFFGLLHTITSRKRLNTVFLVLALMGLFQALYYLFQTFGDHPYIWWFYAEGGGGGPRGTFYNKNALASYLMIVTFAVIGYGLARQPFRNLLSREWRDDPDLQNESFRSFLYVFVSAIIMVAIVFSESRSGIMTLLIVFSLMMSVYVLKRRKRSGSKGRKRRPRGNLLNILLIIVCACVFRAGIDPVLLNYERTDTAMLHRARFNQQAYLMSRDYISAGSGMGTFEYVFPKYQHLRDAAKRFPHAHNHWLQFLTEGGAIGLVLLLALIGTYLASFLKRWQKRTDQYAINTGNRALLPYC